ncbi:MAG: 4-hydroxythreonine-4-phosphate dehydrogenase PdxA [Legionella sp.]|nr:4-hydroxythreonine-4-phosphate dehydrogenase PdxA [Legionella sp.]
MKPLLISSGEPAGIGPDICLALAKKELPVVILGDKKTLMARADKLELDIEFLDYNPNLPFEPRKNSLFIKSVPGINFVVPGKLDTANAAYVISMLEEAVRASLLGEFSALVTAPVHKEIINRAGVSFTGHTEFLAHHCGVDTVVMMLACETMKVALITTHLPLKLVAPAITAPLITNVIRQLHRSLQVDFGLIDPRILVAGLNPHAGEGGYLGREEIDTIAPALKLLQSEGINVQGPFPADTLFTPKYTREADAFVAMYHDQGLPVLKYAGFGQAVNVTLGLPIIRTSVDHGTALDLAGTGQADPGSLLAAVLMAMTMVQARVSHEKN